MLREEIDKKIVKGNDGMWIDTELKTSKNMECDIKEPLEEFMQYQTIINNLFDKTFDNIKEELSGQDDVNEEIIDCFRVMTKRINDLENRLNKLEKEKRRNATNK